MVPGRSQAVAGLVAVSVLGFTNTALGRGQAQSAQSPVPVSIRLDNQAGVGAAVLKFAKARAAEVFAKSGIEIRWIDGQDAIRQHLVVPFSVLIMAEGPAKQKAAAEGLQDGVMGQGLPFAGRAYIYFDRIVASVYAPRDTVTQLGDVIAHEVGHVLLPPGHSSVGIMRPSLDLTTRRVETFTEAEAITMKQRLNDSRLPE